MTDDRPDKVTAAIDRFGQRYRLWLVIPVIIALGMAAFDVPSAVGFAAFMVTIWVFIGVVALASRGILWLLPANLAEKARTEISASVALTLFLGGLAVTGLVLRSDTAFSHWISDVWPEGMRVGFIDPVFASVVVVLSWAYTVFKLRK
jgi:hypothetical protein